MHIESNGAQDEIRPITNDSEVQECPHPAGFHDKLDLKPQRDCSYYDVNLVHQDLHHAQPLLWWPKGNSHGSQPAAQGQLRIHKGLLLDLESM